MIGEGVSIGFAVDVDGTYSHSGILTCRICDKTSFCDFIPNSHLSISPPDEKRNMMFFVGDANPLPRRIQPAFPNVNLDCGGLTPLSCAPA
jgi:hypothetical protein